MRRGNNFFNKRSWDEDDERNRQLYTKLAEKYGRGVRSLNWGSRDSQYRRLAVLGEVGTLNGASVLDVGCGMGDLLEWLRVGGKEVDYTGVDLTPKMIEMSRARFPGSLFILGSLFDVREKLEESYDFVLASGIFYYRQKAPWQFLAQMVRLMFQICRKAVAFNSLSAWAPRKQPKEYYANPLATVAFCRTLTPWVVLRHDYHPGDFTIYMYKARSLSP